MSVKKITVTALETALKDIMRQTPFEKITVSDITNRCQLNRQTFYYHFADKYALLGQIYKQEIFDPFTDGLTFENWNTHCCKCLRRWRRTRRFIRMRCSTQTMSFVDSCSRVRRRCFGTQLLS